MSKHIYLHIGMHKTGTTALQKFFLENQKVLKKNDITFIKTLISKKFCSLFAPYPNWQKLYEIKEDKDKWKEKFIANIHNSTSNNVLISSERFSAFSFEKIKELGHIFENFKVSIIYYIRRQDTWLESNYQQHFKSKPAFSKTFEKWLNNASPYLERICNNYDHLSEWASVFGKENVIVRPYEKKQFVNGNIFDDFMSIFDLCLNDDFNTLAAANVSLTQDFLEIIRMANMLPIENRHKQIEATIDNFLSHKLINLAPATCRLVKNKKNVFLSPIERMEILKKYEHNNRLVAREYLGRKDGKLFYDPLPDINEPYEPHQLTLEKVTPIFIEMIYTLNKRIEKLEKQQVLHAQQLLELQRSRREKIKHLAKRIIPKPLHPLAQKTWNTLKTSTSSKTDI